MRIRCLTSIQNMPINRVFCSSGVLIERVWKTLRRPDVWASCYLFWFSSQSHSSCSPINPLQSFHLNNIKTKAVHNGDPHRSAATGETSFLFRVFDAAVSLLSCPPSPSSFHSTPLFTPLSTSLQHPPSPPPGPLGLDCTAITVSDR
jgi:hypothetical protein